MNEYTIFTSLSLHIAVEIELCQGLKSYLVPVVSHDIPALEKVWGKVEPLPVGYFCRSLY